MTSPRGSLRVGALTASFGPRAPVLLGVDLSVEPGEMVAIIGPSGCGKTTLLRAIAGHHACEAGSVVVDDKVLDGRPPEDRPTAMVFQSDTLFPDLTVEQNIAYGLHSRGGRSVRASEEVAVVMLRLGLTGLESRFPNEISGGQARRVAIARAMVVRPAVLLLDEPLSGLDQRRSRLIMRQVRAAQQRLGLTTLMVLHDQEHALSWADRVAVMNRGRVEQVGPPGEVFRRPANTFVAEFLGQTTFVAAEVLSHIGEGSSLHAVVSLFGEIHQIPAHPDVGGGEPAVVVLRPHALKVVASDPSSVDAPGGTHAGVVQECHYYGDRIEYVVETEEANVVGQGTLTGAPIEPGTPVRLLLDAPEAWVLPLR